jgi:peptide/nickel transport system substrate-binding protein
MAQQDGGVLRVGLVSEATSLDPITTNNVPSSIIFMQIHDSLVTYDEDLNIVPMLASSWELAEDAMTYTFHLREGVTFHNGEPFTAADVVYAFKTGADPSYQSQWLGRFELIEHIEAVDDHTVVLKIVAPNAAFLDQITYFGIPSMKAHQELGGDGYAIAPVGSGPFRFVSWQRNDKLILERNDDYWLTRPHLDGVEFRAIPERNVAAVELEVGGVDVAMSLSADDVLRLENSSTLTVGTTPTLSYYYVAMNNESGPLADVRVRKALQYAIPMDQLVDAIFHGVGAIRAWTSMAPGNLGYEEELITEFPQYDPEHARQLLAEAGYPNGFSTVLYTPTDSNRRQLAELVQAALSLVGVKVEVRAVELGTMLPLTYQGDAPMWILGWTSGTDPNNYSYEMFHSDPDAWADSAVTFNTSRYSNAEVDRLLSEARTLSDMEERLPYYHQAIRKIFLEDAAQIAAYHQTFNLGYRNDVNGLHMNPNSRMSLVPLSNNVGHDRG